jgi:hypothetical protein
MAAMGAMGSRQLQDIESKKKISEQFKNMGRDSYHAAGGMFRFGNTTAGATNSVRQAAFGIQDVAIMLQAGGGWDRAILGAMNNLGALAMGMGIVGTVAITAAAVGIPMVVRWFMKADDAAKKLAESLGSVRDRYRGIGDIGRELGEVREDIAEARLPKEERERAGRQREAVGRGLGMAIPPAEEEKFIREKLASGLEQELRLGKKFEGLGELPKLRLERAKAIDMAIERATQESLGSARAPKRLTPEEKLRVAGAAEVEARRKFGAGPKGEAIAGLEALELELQRKAGIEGAKVLRDAMKGSPEAQRRLSELAPEFMKEVRPVGTREADLSLLKDIAPEGTAGEKFAKMLALDERMAKRRADLAASNVRPEDRPAALESIKKIGDIERERIEKGEHIPPSFVGIEEMSRKIQMGISPADAKQQQQLDELIKIREFLEAGGFKLDDAAVMSN